MRLHGVSAGRLNNIKKAGVVDEVGPSTRDTKGMRYKGSKMETGER